MDEPATAPPAPRRWRRWWVPAAAAAVVIALTVAVKAGGPVVTLDDRIRAAVQSVAQAPRWRWIEFRRHSIANTLVNLGKIQMALPVLAVAAAVAALARRRLGPLLAAVAGVVLMVGIVIPAKILVGRTGPGYPPLPPGHLGSFPSGHTATAGLCFILAAVLVAPALPRLAGRALIAATVALTLAVGAALVWIDAHWTSDVIASLALVTLVIWVAAPLAALGRRPARSPQAPAGPAGRERRQPERATAGPEGAD